MSPVWPRLDRGIGKLFLDGEDATALGLLRIALVSVLTASLLSHVGAVADYFSADSIIAGEFAREAFGERFSVFHWLAEPWMVRTIFAIGVLAHVAWLFGLYTRPAAVVAWLVWVSMSGRHPLLYSLADQLQMALCTLLMLLPSGRGLSLDVAWRNRGGEVPVWCRRVIQLQLAVMYTATGLLKTGSTWREDGTALYYALSNPYNRHFDIPEILATLQPWVLRPMTWVTLVWEVSFCGFVLIHWVRELLGNPRRVPDLRKLFLPIGLGIHLGIQAMLYVAWFSPLAIAAYVAFLRPDEARWLVDGFRRRILRRA